MSIGRQVVIGWSAVGLVTSLAFHADAYVHFLPFELSTGMMVVLMSVSCASTIPVIASEVQRVRGRMNPREYLTMFPKWAISVWVLATLNVVVQMQFAGRGQAPASHPTGSRVAIFSQHEVRLFTSVAIYLFLSTLLYFATARIHRSTGGPQLRVRQSR